MRVYTWIIFKKRGRKIIAMGFVVAKDASSAAWAIKQRVTDRDYTYRVSSGHGYSVWLLLKLWLRTWTRFVWFRLIGRE